MLGHTFLMPFGNQPRIEASALFYWLQQHPLVALWTGCFCLCLSVALILRLWLLHRRAGWFKKLSWSVMLLVPFFGWLCYAAMFRLPEVNDKPCPKEHAPV
jgi:tryptophan-rich sensory protein